jgi:hypothetical protein
MIRGYIKNNKISWRIYDFRTSYFGDWSYQHQFCLGRFTLKPTYKTWSDDKLAETLNMPKHIAYCYEWLWLGIVIRKKK